MDRILYRNVLAIFALIVAMIFFPSALFAQDIKNEAEIYTIYERDSLLNGRSPVDSTLIGRSVIDMIEADGSNISICRSVSVDAALPIYLKNNSEKKLNGYRIRIFFDNKQTARAQSEEIEKNFAEQFPQCPVYRTYTNPYFKVAVGDFRTKSDAVKVLETVKREYPKAFIIKDIINYPL